MKSLNKFDLVFVGVVVAGFAVAGWLLYAESLAGGGAAREKVVGFITYKAHFAERKVNGEVLWDGVEQRSPVYNDDTIRTTEGSSAVIHLQNQTEISMGERTMVLVSVAERTKIGVTGGMVAVRTSTSGGSAPVTMTTSSGTVSLTSGSVAIADSSSGTKVNVESGTATVTGGAKTQNVAENTVVSLNGSAPVALSLVPLLPRSGQTVQVSDQNPQVGFQWTQAGLDPAAPTGRLTIASDSEFKNIEYQGDFAGTGTARVLGEGTHYWKLSSAGAETSARWFSVVVQGPPRVLEPASDRVFHYSEGLPLVSVSWLPLAFAASYRVEVYTGSVEGKPLDSSVTPLSVLALNTLKEGDYQARVVALSGQDGQEFASQAVHFTIKRNRLTTPRVKGAEELSAEAVKNGAVLASWDEVEGADRYRAVVTRPPSESPVLSIETSANALSLDQSLSPGSYSVRVTALSGTADSEASPAVFVKIAEIKPLAALAPLTGATLDPGDRTVVFRWSDPNGGSRYRVTLSPDSSFDHPFLSVDSTAEQASAQIPEGRSGVLFWRVQLLSDSNSLLSASESSSFTLPRLFQDPKPISPANGESLDVNVTEVLQFRWLEVPEATSYKVTLYRMSGGFKSPVQTWTTEKSTVILDSFADLAAEPYAWEVRAQDASENHAAGQSRAVTSYFRLVQSHPLLAPRKILAGPEDQP